jgi:hypothetical protein
VEKQNCGVRCGCTDGWVMISLGRPRLGGEGDVGASTASAAGALLLDQNVPATVTVLPSISELLGFSKYGSITVVAYSSLML